ncbi:phosphotransferase [Aeromicrobium sp.]|uniref:phosphotransferase n=1 Tax=Aeromicrobium sp. TaxID=1871063 RepID=UPI0025B8DBDE|nr:phosphotransferase [Aeromicrobium sp.]MCK5890884.1 phosphotransferase [Aeromicrobium sp.]
MTVEDTLRRWGSPEWRREASTWIQGAAASDGRTLTGQMRTLHMRFWSVVIEVPTDRGRLWFKECAPGQGFEPALLSTLAELEPDHFVRPVAVDARSGRVLLPDLGANLRGRGDEEWGLVVAALARLQQRLSTQHDPLASAGLPAMPAGDAVEYVDVLAQRLANLPSSHAQHLTVEAATRVLSRLDDVAEWSERLAASPIASTFQHNDASPANTFGRPGTEPRWIDVGDAFWSHPFAVLQVPIAMTTGTWPWGPDWSDPRAQVIAEGYLQQWRDHADLASLRDLLEPARRMAILHRCESWRRLLDDAGELADDPSHPILRDHLVAATGERRP